MSKNLIDQINNMSRQSFASAAIVNAKGDQTGKIIIRFTDATIGWNHEVGVLMYGDEFPDLTLGKTLKGSTYAQPTTLVRVFNAAGCKVFNHHGDEIVTRENADDNENTVPADSLSSFHEVMTIKKGNKKYRILWVM